MQSVRHAGDQHFSRSKSSSCPVSVEAGVTGDGTDPRHHGFGGTISMARAVNPHPAVLQHVLCVIPTKLRTPEVAEKRPRDLPHELIESCRIGSLVLRHQRPQLKVVNRSVGHFVRPVDLLSLLYQDAATERPKRTAQSSGSFLPTGYWPVFSNTCRHNSFFVCDRRKVTLALPGAQCALFRG